MGLQIGDLLVRIPTIKYRIKIFRSPQPQRWCFQMMDVGRTRLTVIKKRVYVNKYINTIYIYTLNDINDTHTHIYIYIYIYIFNAKYISEGIGQLDLTPKYILVSYIRDDIRISSSITCKGPKKKHLRCYQHRPGGGNFPSLVGSRLDMMNLMVVMVNFLE